MEWQNSWCNHSGVISVLIFRVATREHTPKWPSNEHISNSSQEYVQYFIPYKIRLTCKWRKLDRTWLNALEICVWLWLFFHFHFHRFKDNRYKHKTFVSFLKEKLCHISENPQMHPKVNLIHQHAIILSDHSSMHCREKAWNPQIWPVSQNQNCAHIRKINRPRPKSKEL